MTASNHAFSAFSFISFVLTSIPFVWHLQAWNTGTCIYVGWISLGSLFLFINSVVWDGNAIDWAPVYCDIVTKFLIGVTVSIPAAALCINRRLYHIVRVTSVARTISEKRRGVFIDLAIGVGIPILIMILHVVVQGHRYDIYEDVGCWPTIYNTYLTYALIFGPTLGIAIIACIYSVLTILALKRNYLEFKKLLSSNGTNKTSANRYIRLMCLAGLEALFDVPINVYATVVAAKSGVQPWISWEETHFDFNVIGQIPALLWRSDPVAAAGLERTRWTVVICGFIFFAFFGFAEEATKNYRLAYNFMARKFGWRTIGVPGAYRGVYDGTGPSGGNGSKRTGTPDDVSGSSGMKKGGLLRGNGTESWMNSFDAFANKIKLVVLQSSGSISFSGQSTTGRNPNNQEHSVYVSTEMVQKRDADTGSIFTSLTEFSCTTQSCEEDVCAIQKKPSGSTCVGNMDEEKHGAQHDDEGLEPAIVPCSPPPPPLPPKDWPPAVPLTIIPEPALHHLTPTRTPPRQMIPSSVSVSPTPNGSFLDLTTSELEIPPVRDVHSADNYV